MHENVIDGKLLSKMLINSFAHLTHNRNYLDELNVFPVSDSDTGTNLKNTFEKGVESLVNEASFHDVISTFVKGMLIGSRGNSGLILSQYFWGIYEYTKDKETISVFDFSNALNHAYTLAYNSVLDPVEGTVLTVMRDSIINMLPKIDERMSVKRFLDLFTDDLFLRTLDTLHQMSVLQDNNVVDSGALGFYLIFEGMRRAIHEDPSLFDCEQNNILPKRTLETVKNMSFFRYCTEFILKKKDDNEKEYYVDLIKDKGESIVVMEDGGLLKVHLHTNEPERTISTFAKYGSIVSKKVDDLFLTQEFARLKHRNHEGFVVLAFTNGEGNANILEQLGADVAFCLPPNYLPSEDELKMIINSFGDENLVVFPADKNCHELLRKIKWYSNLKNLYVVESDSMVKTFFKFSSLTFIDDYNYIIRQLENQKKLLIFEAAIKVTSSQDSTLYTCYIQNKVFSDNYLSALLDKIANRKALQNYSTIVVFGGAQADQKDISSVIEHFEEFANADFTYLDNQQSKYVFIIGAY